MPRNLLNQAEDRLRAPFHRTDQDVFCLVKKYVSDTQLSQPALLVFPGSERDRLDETIRKIGEGTVSCVGLRFQSLVLQMWFCSTSLANSSNCWMSPQVQPHILRTIARRSCACWRSTWMSFTLIVTGVPGTCCNWQVMWPWIGLNLPAWNGFWMGHPLTYCGGFQAWMNHHRKQCTNWRFSSIGISKKLPFVTGQPCFQVLLHVRENDVYYLLVFAS